MASGETGAPDGNIAWRQQEVDGKGEERGSSRPIESPVPTRERRVGWKRRQGSHACSAPLRTHWPS